MIGYRPVGWVEPAIPIDKQVRQLLGIAALNPTYERTMVSTVAWGRSGLDRDSVTAEASRPRRLLRTTMIDWVGWITLFSSTIAIGGWIKRHPPYGLLRSPDAIRGGTSRCLGKTPGFHPGYGFANLDWAVAP